MKDTVALIEKLIEIHGNLKKKTKCNADDCEQAMQEMLDVFKEKENEKFFEKESGFFANLSKLISKPKKQCYRCFSGKVSLDPNKPDEFLDSLNNLIDKLCESIRGTLPAAKFRKQVEEQLAKKKNGEKPSQPLKVLDEVLKTKLQGESSSPSSNPTSTSSSCSTSSTQPVSSPKVVATQGLFPQPETSQFPPRPDHPAPATLRWPQKGDDWLVVDPESGLLMRSLSSQPTTPSQLWSKAVTTLQPQTDWLVVDTESRLPTRRLQPQTSSSSSSSSALQLPFNPNQSAAPQPSVHTLNKSPAEPITLPSQLLSEPIKLPSQPTTPSQLWSKAVTTLQPQTDWLVVDTESRLPTRRLQPQTSSSSSSSSALQLPFNPNQSAAPQPSVHTLNKSPAEPITLPSQLLSEPIKLPSQPTTPSQLWSKAVTTLQPQTDWLVVDTESRLPTRRLQPQTSSSSSSSSALQLPFNPNQPPTAIPQPRLLVSQPEPISPPSLAQNPIVPGIFEDAKSRFNHQLFTFMQNILFAKPNVHKAPPANSYSFISEEVAACLQELTEKTCDFVNFPAPLNNPVNNPAPLKLSTETREKRDTQKIHLFVVNELNGLSEKIKAQFRNSYVYVRKENKIYHISSSGSEQKLGPVSFSQDFAQLKGVFMENLEKIPSFFKKDKNICELIGNVKDILLRVTPPNIQLPGFLNAVNKLQLAIQIFPTLGKDKKNVLDIQKYVEEAEDTYAKGILLHIQAIQLVLFENTPSSEKMRDNLQKIREAKHVWTHTFDETSGGNNKPLEGRSYTVFITNPVLLEEGEQLTQKHGPCTFVVKDKKIYIEPKSIVDAKLIYLRNAEIIEIDPLVYMNEVHILDGIIQRQPTNVAKILILPEDTAQKIECTDSKSILQSNEIFRIELDDELLAKFKSNRTRIKLHRNPLCTWVDELQDVLSDKASFVHNERSLKIVDTLERNIAEHEKKLSGARFDWRNKYTINIAELMTIILFIRLCKQYIDFCTINLPLQSVFLKKIEEIEENTNQISRFLEYLSEQAECNIGGQFVFFRRNIDLICTYRKVNSQGLLLNKVYNLLPNKEGSAAGNDVDACIKLLSENLQKELQLFRQRCTSDSPILYVMENVENVLICYLNVLVSKAIVRDLQQPLPTSAASSTCYFAPPLSLSLQL